MLIYKVDSNPDFDSRTTLSTKIQGEERDQMGTRMAPDDFRQGGVEGVSKVTGQKYKLRYEETQNDSVT